MKIIVPIDTDLRLSNIPEETEYPDWDETCYYPVGEKVYFTHNGIKETFQALEKDNTLLEWDSVTEYKKDDVVYYRHDNRIDAYKSLQDANTGNTPSTATDFWEIVTSGYNIGQNPYENPEYWQNLGGTNRYRMFDTFTNTLSEAEDYIEIEVGARKCDTCALFNLDATKIEWKLFDEGVEPHQEVASGTIDLQITTSSSWYEYFYRDIEYKKDVLFNFPIYLNGVLYLKIIKENSTAKCGLCRVGRGDYIGLTQFSVKTGVLDFSRRDEDDRGYSYVKAGYWTKDNDIDVVIPTNQVDIIYRKLAKLRGTPVVWDCNNDGVSYENLLIYGTFKSLDVILSGPIKSQISINIEGIV